MADIRISEAAARSGRRPPLRVLADLPVARPRAPAPRVHADRSTRDSCRAGTRRNCGARSRQPTSSSATSCARGWPSIAPPAVDIATTPEEAEALRAWHRTLHAGGWVGIHWPVEYGGRGASPAQIAIYNQELARARCAAAPRARRPQPRRADADGARHRGAAPALDAADPRRRRRLVPAVQRARRRERPRRASRPAPRSATASTS